MSNDWLQVAKALPEGQKARIVCCKGDTSMLVSHSARGFHGWCFRCTRKEYEAHGDRRISDILRAKAERNIVTQQEVALPDDYTLEVPMAHAVWYMKAGISPELARQYGIGYSPSLERIILPVYENSVLAAVQMRACTEKQQPKYLNMSRGQSAALFYSASDYNRRMVVVTEDILSAIKVGRVINAVSILGSHINDDRIMKIVRRWHEVTLWLDPDKAGQDGMADAIRKFQMQGIKVSRIISEKDPKLHSLDEIQNYLNGVNID